MLTLVTESLLWIAVAVQAVLAAVSFRLVTTMDLLFQDAVVEKEQAIWPGVIAFLSVLGGLATAAAAVILRMAVRGRWRAVWVVLVVVELVLPALLLDVPVGYVATIVAANEVSRQVYSTWYVPLVVAGVWVHAALLIAGVVASVWQFRQHVRQPADHESLDGC